MQEKLTTALVCLVAALMAVLSAPGLDGIDPKGFDEPHEIEETLARPTGRVELALVELETRVRRPIAGALSVLEKPARISQSWQLYGGGQSKRRILTVLVDEQPRYRTADPSLTWLSRVFRNRRFRPIVEATCKGQSKRWQALTEYVAHRAQQDFGATSVRLQCSSGPLGSHAQQLARQYVAEAPEWKARREAVPQ